MFSFGSSLRAKIVASLVISMVIVLLSGLFAMLQTKMVLEKFDTEGDIYDANARAVLQLQVDFKQQVQEWKDVLLRGQEPALLTKHWGNLQRLEASIQKEGEQLLTRLPSSEAEPHLRRFLTEHRQLGQRYRSALAAFANSHDSHLADSLMAAADREPTEQLRDAVNHIVAEADKFSERTVSEAWQTALANFALMFLALFSGLALLLVSLKRSVIAPLSGLVDFAHRFAEGQRGLRMRSRSQDEIGAVVQAFNHASEEIDRLVADLEASEAQYRDLIDGVDAIVWTLDVPSQKFTFVSQSAERILGYPVSAWLEQPGFWERHVHPDDLDRNRQKVAEILDHGAGEFQYRALTADGDVVWLHNRVRTISDGKGRGQLLGVVIDVSRLKQAEARTEYLATHEKLTNLPNRHLLMDRLEQAIAQAKRSEQKVGLVVVNLDRLKRVNESLGYRLGDEVIKQVALRLLAYIRLDDTVAHLGRDEYAIVLRDVSKPEHLAEVAGKVLKAVAEPLKIEGQTLSLTCSIGISVYPKDGENAEDLLRNAEAALHRLRVNGNNDFRFYAEEMNSRALERLKLENALRRAIDNRELVLHYQPQVELGTNRMIGVEALIRWQHPETGLVPPSEFIPLAEETGLILPMGDYILREACRQNKAWQDEGLPPLCVAVNLSAKQFVQPGLLENIAAILEESALNPQYLELEITESVAMHDGDFVIETLHALRILGLQLAIDDFGTGYSSLSYLKRFPIDKLKIDRSFVRDINVDSENAAIVSAITAMARSMNLKVIAEGVETEGQLEYLQGCQCDEAQGYYFSRPVDAATLTQMLRESGPIVQGGMRAAG